jgi:hypothetical protein
VYLHEFMLKTICADAYDVKGSFKSATEIWTTRIKAFYCKLCVNWDLVPCMVPLTRKQVEKQKALLLLLLLQKSFLMFWKLWLIKLILLSSFSFHMKHFYWKWLQSKNFLKNGHQASEMLRIGLLYS